MEQKTIDMALFPLGIFLLPGERTPLHIFETRYRQLFAEVEQEGKTFGIPYAVSRDTPTHGASCRLLRVTKRYATGESDVLIECTGLFKVKDYSETMTDRLYPFGTVEMMSEAQDWTVSEAVMFEFSHYVNVMQKSKLPFGHPQENAFLPILSSLNLMSDQKFNIISLEDSNQRDEALLNSIRFGRLLVEQENAVEEGVYLS